MCNVKAYLRVSTDEQDLENQRLEINSYAENNGMAINEWIEVEASSRKHKHVTCFTYQHLGL